MSRAGAEGRGGEARARRVSEGAAGRERRGRAAAMALGAAAVIGAAAGVGALVSAFAEERAELLASLAGEQAAVEREVARALDGAARAHLEVARLRVARALEDPLVEAPRALAFEDGRLVWPRPVGSAIEPGPSLAEWGVRLSTGTAALGPAEAPGRWSAEAAGRWSAEAAGTRSAEAPGRSPAEAAGTRSAEAPGRWSAEAAGTRSAEAAGRWSAEAAARSLADAPVAPPTDDDGISARARILAELRRASRARDDAATTASFRALLVARAREVLAPRAEIATALASLEALGASASPAIVRAVIDGRLRDPRFGEIEPVARTLARSRAALSAAELADACARASARVAAVGLTSTALTRACAGRDELVPDDVLAAVATATTTPIRVGAWWLVRDGRRVVGAELDVAAELAAQSARLAERGLIGAEVSLSGPRGAGSEGASSAGLAGASSGGLASASSAGLAGASSGGLASASSGGLAGASSAGLAGDAVRVEAPRWSEVRARATAWYHRKLASLLGAVVVASLAVMALATLRRKARRREREVVELKARFAATVSHELQTPLAAVRVMAETLERRLGDEPRARDYPRRIVAEVDRLGGLVDNILAFQRIEQGRWEVRRERVRLDALLPDLVSEAERAAVGGEVEVDSDGVAGAEVSADARLVRLALLNLVRNACRHNRRKPARIALRARGQVVEVEDNGVGVPPEDVPRLFEEHARGRGAVGQGTGLGLALVARIARLHGGEVRLVRTSGDGSTFAIDFGAV